MEVKVGLIDGVTVGGRVASFGVGTPVLEIVMIVRLREMEGL